VSDALAELLRHPALWRAGDAGAPETIPTGFRALDAQLPGGGWPLATLIELLVPAAGIGEIRLLLPALRRLTAAVPPRWVAWLAPPHLPYAPALADAGLDPARMLVIRPRAGIDRLWAMEQALRSGACAAVLGWVGPAHDTALRRLKLAAEEGATPAFLLRSTAHRGDPSPAALRLALAARDYGLDVVILKSRGGGPARVERLLIH
jgi:cell division inhibitor SulA/protein ImuA